ncbi:hypothetical protein [Photobacterium lutimaris]|uniref:Uncharacterized protein n=1 Tax=Photobacterium lutimaris TaxID=388278 RepID=A0A2T3ITV8_9GAMM|nr:hypothetical protein [Photobacterium lutimaris]PSU31771.1 hypothetical protein C9I99_21545 [Photobacterium lutimaris]TDR72577.1 hypothetical protein DFP78_11353 [Photobacterium lutimaris]
MKKIFTIAVLGMCSTFALAGVDSIRQSGNQYDNINPGSSTLPTGGSSSIISQSLKKSIDDSAAVNETNATQAASNTVGIDNNSQNISSTNSNINTLKGQYNGHETRIKKLESQ